MAATPASELGLETEVAIEEPAATDGAGSSVLASPSVADTRVAILDAAERVFAEKGYDGASMREIARTAEANLGLLNYYFGTKRHLFLAAVERRFETLYDDVAGSVAAANASGNALRPDAVDRLLRAFLLPIMRRASAAGEDWRNYLRLLALGMRSYGDSGLHPTLAKLARISDLLRDNLLGPLGLDSPREIALPCYLIESAIIYVTQDRGLLDIRSGGRFSATRLDEAVDEMVRFFAAGFEAFRSRRN